MKIISLSTKEGDYVLDSFGGSGTTFAVAQKMKRRWIGVEIGSHCENVIIERLKKVILFQDKLGITEEANYQGGGSFKFYKLGQSIIKLDENGNGDFNWSLGKKYIEESLLLSYDYSVDSSTNLNDDQLFEVKNSQPTIGIQKVGIKLRVAIVSLNEPKGKMGIMPYEEIQSIYKTIKKKFSPTYINIFTNRGVEIAYDSKPDDLEIIKVPHAIFAELEK
jgi:adenine-specific DNA-methyltransferase